MIHTPQPNSDWAKTASGLIVPAAYKPKPRPKAFDFFAGCGGFSCGLTEAGFQVVGALEMDYSAAQTYMVNLGSYPMKIHFDTDERAKGFDKFLEKQLKAVVKKHGFVATSATLEDRIDNNLTTFGLTGSGWISRQKYREGCEHFWIADIKNITGKIILDALGMERGELDLVVGSPPCQGFSTINIHRNEDDVRNVLAFEYARLLVELYPKTLALEEVPEFAKAVTADGINILEGFCKILADGDYAPFESLMRSMHGRKGAKAILRSEKKQKKTRPKKRTLGLKKPNSKSVSTTAQASLF